MKTFTIITVVVLCTIFVSGPDARTFAQDKKISKKDVPAAVLTAFQKAYPNAKIKGFLTETEGGKTYFEIESVEGKKTIDALVQPDGTIYEVEEGMPAKELPEAVRTAVAAKYPKGTIDSKVEKTTQGSTVTYDLTVTTGKSKVGVTIDPTGKIIKETKKSAKKEKEEKEED
jgi:hypothetical protein